MPPKKRIGVFTSGGDCAGLNSAIMSVVKAGIIKHGWDMVGVCDGQEGLMAEAPSIELGLSYPFGEAVRQGGTFLGAFSRANNKGAYTSEMEMIKSLSDRFVKGVRQIGLAGLIGCGGNGGILFISNFARTAGLPFVGIPKTMDNDVPTTEACIGFDSALNVCVSSLDSIFWTAKSHRRAMVLELMGRDAGHLAMHAGVASNADVVLVPEIPYTIAGIVGKINAVKKTEGRQHFLIAVSEGAGQENGEKLDRAKYLNVAHYVEVKLTEAGITSRGSVLGHIQRGSIATAYDRNLATIYGNYAVDTFAKGARSSMVAMQGGRLTTIDLSTYREDTRLLDTESDIVRTARDLGIYIGEIRQSGTSTLDNSDTAKVA